MYNFGSDFSSSYFKARYLDYYYEIVKEDEIEEFSDESRTWKINK